MSSYNPYSLPEGWEEKEDSRGCAYYVNHVTRETTWKHPHFSEVTQLSPPPTSAPSELLESLQKKVQSLESQLQLEVTARKRLQEQVEGDHFTTGINEMNSTWQSRFDRLEAAHDLEAETKLLWQEKTAALQKSLNFEIDKRRLIESQNQLKLESLRNQLDQEIKPESSWSPRYRNSTCS